jgi:hypothetical protein
MSNLNNNLEIRSEGDLILKADTDRSLILKSSLTLSENATKPQYRQALGVVINEDVQGFNQKLKDIADLNLNTGDIFKWDGSTFIPFNLNDLNTRVSKIEEFLNIVTTSISFYNSDGEKINYEF